MNLNDGGVAFQHMEARKQELLRQARIERLAKEAQENPEQVQRGWKRLIADLFNVPAKLTPAEPPNESIEPSYSRFKVS
jgi:hypothetical protein